MLSLCSARHILDPREQVGTFELLGAQPVTDRDTFPEFVLGAVFPRKDVLIFFNSFQAADGIGLKFKQLILAAWKAFGLLNKDSWWNLFKSAEDFRFRELLLFQQVMVITSQLVVNVLTADNISF